MADFKSYWKVDITPAGWYPKGRLNGRQREGRTMNIAAVLFDTDGVIQRPSWPERREDCLRVLGSERALDLFLTAGVEAELRTGRSV